MFQRNRDVYSLGALAAVISTLLALWLWPAPLSLPSYDPADHASRRYQPGGSDCLPGSPTGRGQEAQAISDRCAEATEEYQLQRSNLFQQEREANAAEAQAGLSYDVAFMVLVGTVGGVCTLFAAGAAALYARDAARAARAGLSHSAQASDAELRPWLELDIVPNQFRLNDSHASVRFAVHLKNLGKLPATGVYMDGRIYDAGSHRNEIPEYFADEFKPPKDRLPRTILPHGRIELEGSVPFARGDLLLAEANGESVVSPVLAVRVFYQWVGGTGTTCLSYEMSRRKRSAEENRRPIPINPNGDTRREFDVRQTRFDRIL